MSVKPYIPYTKTPPCTPTASSSDNASIEFQEYSNQYERIYRDIWTLVRKITSMKIYCCDEYEVYCLSNTNWLNDLEWDKLSLALNAAALEELRIDVLQWVAKLSVGPLPAEIVCVIYDVILKSKYQGHEDPWDKVFEQDRFSNMIAASGMEYDPRDEIVSRQNSPCLSLQSATETSESGPLEYLQAIDFNVPSDEDDGRYQDSARYGLLDGDITRDMSPDPFSDADLERLHSKTGNTFQCLKRRCSSSTSDDRIGPRKRISGKNREYSPDRVS